MKTQSRKVIVWSSAGLAAVALVLLSLYFVYPKALPWLGRSPAGPSSAPAADYFPTEGWRAVTPEEMGFDSAKLAEGLVAIRKAGIPIHSLTLVGHGRVFLDAYFYPYDGSTYHDLASDTKSIMTTLIGIAATQGKLSPDATMLSFFPDRTIANRDARKERITVRHLASMSSGLDCTEADGERTLKEMRASGQDWVQFVLDRPVAWEPGTHFVYCSPGMHLLSAILHQATGMTAMEFARENLFKPLGITEAYWSPGPDGNNFGWGDLALQPRDAAKIGYLWLHGGNWNGQQIISPEWVKASSKGYFSGTGRYEDYGYGWWISPASEDPPYILAAGNGGQRIQILPGLDLVIVTTGGGFEFDQVGSYIEAAIISAGKPTAANPAGAAKLDVGLAEISKPPAAQPVTPLPDAARAASGKTFTPENNSALFRSVRFDWKASEVETRLDIAGEASPRILRVGLDGIYRMSLGGRPSIARGHWTDASTFMLEIQEGPGLNSFLLPFHFEGNKVSVAIAGLGSFEGRIAGP